MIEGRERYAAIPFDGVASFIIVIAKIFEDLVTALPFIGNASVVVSVVAPVFTLFATFFFRKALVRCGAVGSLLWAA